VTALVGAELLKARTTRTAFALALGLLAIVALFVTVQVFTVDYDLTTTPTRDTLDPTAFAPFFALLFGILATTGEWRHGTISQTFLVTPRRAYVIGAKVLSGALVGVALAIVASALALAIAAIGVPSQGGTFDGGEAAGFVAKLVLGALLWGALGAAIGGVLTNQIGAVIGTLIELFIVESIVVGIRPHIGEWLPAQAMFEGVLAHGGGDHLSPGAGTLVTLAYVAAFTAAATLLAPRRDVT
jgi:ABC-2 type transport system permease protein